MPSDTSSAVASGVTGHGTETTTNSGRSVLGPTAVTSSSMVRTVGTPQSCSTCAPRSADRVTTPTHWNRSGIRRAIRTKNSARHPLPTTPNLMGAMEPSSSSDCIRVDPSPL